MTEFHPKFNNNKSTPADNMSELCLREFVRMEDQKQLTVLALVQVSYFS